MSQVQTEGVNLAAVEEALLGDITSLPTSGWFNIQPNSYGNFGPSFKKLPRDPISKNQQLRKGMLVDEDSGIPFETDVTKDVIDRFGEGIYRSKFKHSGGTGVSLFRPTKTTATGFTVAALGNLQQRTIVFSRGWQNPENNGVFLVNAASTGTEIKVTGLVIEDPAPSTAEVEVAGFRFATTDLALDNDGNLTNTVADFTTMGLTALQWLVVGGRDDASGIYSFATPEFRGAVRIASGGIAAHKLTLDRRTWLVQQHAYLDIGAVSTGNIDTIVEAILPGPNGNLITIQVIADSGTAAGSIVEVGNAITFHVKTAATATTVTQFEALVAQSTLIRVKTADPTGADPLLAGDVFGPTALAHGDEGPDAGTGKTVEVYFTKFVRNVPIDHADYKLPSWAFEVTYPTLAAGAPEYEYLFGNMVNEAVWNFPLAGKASINLSFVGTRSLNPSATRKTGPSTALDYASNAGVSTATDLQRLRIAGADELGISTDFQMLKLTDKNNVSPQKQLGRLGARLMNQGKHTAMIEADCIFTSHEVISAVKDNRDATLDILARNDEFGALLDVQAMTLDSSDKKLEKDKSVIISSKATGHQYTTSTDSLSAFAWLPAVAETEQ